MKTGQKRDVKWMKKNKNWTEIHLLVDGKLDENQENYIKTSQRLDK